MLGFRRWTLDGYKLRSGNPYAGAFWRPGENRAECLRREYGDVGIALGGVGPVSPSASASQEPSHSAPDPRCICGLYGFHAVPPDWTTEYDHATLTSLSGLVVGGPSLCFYVYGAVLAWGRIEAHHEGFRAEYAEPVVFAFNDTTMSHRHVRTIEAIGGEFGIPVVAVGDLEAAAREYGAPIPEELRPPAPPADEYMLRWAGAFSHSLTSSNLREDPAVAERRKWTTRAWIAAGTVAAEVALGVFLAWTPFNIAIGAAWFLWLVVCLVKRSRA